MAADALKRYVLTVPEFPDGPYMAEHPAGAWVDHRDYRAMVEKFEVADQELRSYLADVSDQLIYARRDLAALREDIESQIRIASEEATRATELERDAELWRAHMREVERVKDLERRGFGPSARQEMTDDEIEAIWNSMPGGHDGFCKTWGFIDFAQRILEFANIQSTVDGQRYRMLRDPGYPDDGTIFACVYVHAPGTIPYQKAVIGTELDAVIDAALAKTKEQPNA